jgi:predicted nucleotidyltransferase
MLIQKPLNIQIEKLLPQLAELSGSFPKVIAAYAFGSQISGHPTPLSDVDIGILMDGDLADMDSFRIEMNLLGELQRIFKTGNIDLVVLNKAPLPIQYSATSGMLLFANNHEKKCDFEEYVRKYYIDCLPIYREYREEYLKRIKEEAARNG